MTKIFPTVKRDGQSRLGAGGGDLQGAAGANHQSFSWRYQGQAMGHSWRWVVITKEAPLGAASYRGAVAVMN